jgi:hypothetical protein
MQALRVQSKRKDRLADGQYLAARGTISITSTHFEVILPKLFLNRRPRFCGTYRNNRFVSIQEDAFKIVQIKC